MRVTVTFYLKGPNKNIDLIHRSKKSGSIFDRSIFLISDQSFVAEPTIINLRSIFDRKENRSDRWIK